MQRVRFIHASDLHLDRPPVGLADPPDPLAAKLIDVPYQSAQAIFETAAAEKVDFVLLSGGVCDIRAGGPRALAFLAEQLVRLERVGIAVYWAGSAADALHRWQKVFKLPANVRLFSSSSPQWSTHTRRGEPVARICGWANRANEPLAAAGLPGIAGGTAPHEISEEGPFTIALAHGRARREVLAARGIHYWALGGRKRYRTLARRPCVVHYPGASLGKTAQQPGPHGCSLVGVAESGEVSIKFVATDSLRWHDGHVLVGPGAAGDELFAQLRRQAQELLEGHRGPDLLVRWMVAPSGHLAARLAEGDLGADILAKLRREFGERKPALWSVSIEPEQISKVPAEFYEQETLLGEFLRTVRKCEIDSGEPIDLAPLAATRHQRSLAAHIGLADARQRSRVLAEAALLGERLLGPAERSP